MSTSTTSMATLLQGLAKLPEGTGDITPEQLQPTLNWNMAELLKTVAMLWNTVRGHGTFFETVEKEMAKRKTEVEIKLRNMNTEVQDTMAGEARKRQADTERLRADINALKEELAATRAELAAKVDGLDEAMGKKVDKMNINTRISINELGGRISSIREDVTGQRTKTEGALVTVTQVESGVHATTAKQAKEIEALYVLFSVSRDDVIQANGTQRQKDLLYATPPFKAILTRIGHHDDTFSGMKKEIVAHGNEVEGIKTRLATAVNGATEAATATRLIGEQSTARDIGLTERIDALTLSIGKSKGSDKGTLEGIVKLEAYVTAIDGTIHALQDEMRNLMRGLSLKADSGDVKSKAEADFVQSTVEQLQERIDALGNLLDASRGKLEADIEAAMSLASQSRQQATAERRPSVPNVAVHRVDSGIRRGVDGLTEEVHSVQDRLGRLDADILALDSDKIGRQEMEECLASALESLGSLQPQGPPPQAAADDGDGPATSLRFRCLSCNRTAGPLVEKMRERLSNQPFPPSNMYLRGVNADSARRHQSPPAAKGAEATTSSRRKLLNYYDWLKSREEDKNLKIPRGGTEGASQDLVLIEMKSPRRVSLEPHAIGTDGRFYTGVQDQQAVHHHRHGERSVVDRPMSAPPGH